MKLTLDNSVGDVSSLRCEGEINAQLDTHTPNPVEEVLGMGCYNRKVMINLEQASSINSTGVAWLVRCHRNFQDNGGCMVIHSIPPMVGHVLSLLRMTAFLNMAEDEQTALTLLTGAIHEKE